MKLIKYNIENAVITALASKYDIKEIKDSTDYAFVMGGLRECRQIRHKVDEWHKERKADIVKAANFYDGERRRIKGLVATVEDPLKVVRQTEDDRREAIKAEEERKERERIEKIQEKINSIRIQGIIHGGPSSTIKERLVLVQDMKISEETYMEFVEQAIQAQWETITEIKEALAERLQFEKEEVERKAETERLEKIRKEQEEAQKKIDEENRKIEEKAAKIAEEHRILEAEKKAEQNRKEREEFERAAIERAEAYAIQKAKNEAIENEWKEKEEAKEKARQETLRPDKEKLIKFADELLDIAYPHMESGKAIKIIVKANAKVNELAHDIKEQAKTL